MTDTPWAQEAGAVLAALSPAGEAGLGANQVHQARQRFGPNELVQRMKRPAVQIFFAQFRSLIVLLLALAAGVSLFFHDWLEGGAITAVILINALIGFFTELGAVRSMEALRKLTRVTVTVRRSGELRRIPAGQLVPGDIVVVEGGDVIAADIRLTHASRLQANESSLTGESVPVSKGIDPVPVETILAERSDMLYNGTSVTRGAGEGIVVATGMSSELGRISSLVEEAEDETTPLEKRLAHLARKLIWITLAIAALTALAGIRAGKDVYLMIETSIALAVAAIPEGLPIVATMALARGMWRMSKKHALVNRLSAVETLGATSVICTDKTGTLTENRMTVVKLVLADGEEIDFDELPGNHQLLNEALTTAVLCNNASSDGVGDPLEVALLDAATAAGFEKRPHARIHEEAFDSETAMMATTHREGDRFGYHVKGAPESVIAACDDLDPAARSHWIERNEALAGQGLRILALAQKYSTSDSEAPYEHLDFLGLIAMVDPPREDIHEAVDQCLAAGLRIVMITGDQAATAAYVANSVGLTQGLDKSEVVTGAGMESLADLTVPQVFARVSPKQKLEIIGHHQQKGHVVAMTGDGVNDAPALKKADIGIAMGIRGTEVAKEAADMVLKDDAFGTIVTAVDQGRTIFDNIRRFVVYLMSCNLSEILIIALAAAVSSPLPILPLQILFLNMVTDVFPALALGMGSGSGNAMGQPPRDAADPILRRCDWTRIAIFSLLMSATVLGVFALSLQWLGLDVREAVSVAFLTLAGAQIVHVFNMRDHSEAIVKNQITRNRFIWLACVICVALLASALYVPAASNILGLQPPSASGYGLVVAGIAVSFILGQWLASRAPRSRFTHKDAAPSPAVAD